MGDRLQDKKILVTQRGDYMGPAIETLFSEEGAILTSKDGPVPTGEDFAQYVADLPEFDIVVANLSHDPCSTPVGQLDNFSVGCSTTRADSIVYSFCA